ncbi:MAG: hypothetical protein GX130_02085 [Candidatus Hydrogenedens sp.]|jgi:hypothetical protein|nr:hypothetical protein [Candidatus Hydrogenedens sp.]
MKFSFCTFFSSSLSFLLILALAPVCFANEDVSRYEAAWLSFQEPSNAYKGKPFWSWNGKLEKEELLRQIDVLEEMGFGGFFMHSRTGLVTEYLGEEWFDLINVCADEAEKRNLEAWLYDEDRWPSGSAGGKATENPEYQMKYLLMDIFDASEFEWEDRFIAAFSCDLDGLNYRNLQRLDKGQKHSGTTNTVLAFSVKYMDSSSFYNGNTYLDTMSKEATEHFIALTHEAYKEHCGDRIGTSIKGIFTDEPHRGMVMCHKVDQGGLTDSERCTPWTRALPEAFSNAYGYDLLDHLPALFLRPEGERIVRVKWEYMELIQQLFLDNFAKPMLEWCQEHDMILTGHALHEDTLGAQAVPCGSMMRFYEYMDYPGVDVLTEGNRNYWIVKQLASTARQLDKKWMLSELYGCTGWQFNFASHKAVGDWQSLFGINLRCHHLSWYTMEGEAKRDFPASIFYQSAWYPEYKHVENYFSRINTLMSRGKPDCHILVLNPVESAWAQIHTGWASWLSATAPEVVALDRKYQQLLTWLFEAQLDFDIGDEDILMRHGNVVQKDGPVLQVGKGNYDLVIVSGLESIRATTLDMLEAFQAAGGSLLFADEAPAHVNGDRSDRAAVLAGKSLQVPFEREELLQACTDRIQPAVSITHEEHEDWTRQIFTQSRLDGALRYVMALNTNREEARPGFVMTVKGEGVVEEWDSLTGGRMTVPTRNEEGLLHFSVDFPAGGEKLYVIRPEADPSLPVKESWKEVRRISLKGPAPYRLSEPNVCVLDRAACNIDDVGYGTPMEILKIDQYIRDRYGLARRGGEMLQPWFAGKQEKVIRGAVKIRFDFEVETIPEALYLVMEQPGMFSVLVNGESLSTAEDAGWWVDTCLRKLVLPPSMLKPGENLIEISVDFHEEVNLEALYLLGEFGVRLDGIRRILTELPETLEFADIADQGLPFYSGAIEYLVELPDVAKDSDETVFFHLPAFEAACAKISPGDEEALLPWAPHEAKLTEAPAADEILPLTVILTRRNSFGPLHQVTLRAGGYGPGSWVTTGKDFMDAYNLYPAGILKEPELIIRQAI